MFPFHTNKSLTQTTGDDNIDKTTTSKNIIFFILYYNKFVNNSGAQLTTEMFLYVFSSFLSSLIRFFWVFCLICKEKLRSE